ncbi:MAG: xanthan lyase [Prevotella sp.]|nr:xanthan lyase [Prevotella sp.]
MMNKKRLVVTLWAGLTALLSLAQKSQSNALENYFANYKAAGQIIRSKSHLDSLRINDSLKTVTVYANNAFGEQLFTKPSTDFIYNDVRKLLHDSLRNYQLIVKTGGWAIEELIPNRLSTPVDKSRTWGDIDYKGKPWVFNAMRPYTITRGLGNRHFTVWASHGIYYSLADEKWMWQRPPLFATSEDLFTQTIVTPYLIPMLENAGAYVFTPRERDWQKHEVIVDNDSLAIGYTEQSIHHPWQPAPMPGFGMHAGNYVDHENPFEAGTTRMIEATEHKHHLGHVIYQPTIPEAGRYAVYVSYQTVEGSIDDARYTVWHKGVATEFHVNQQMGGSTWVYLGTFDFDAGCNEQNRVVLSNFSDKPGIVTADAVRFGGGMGNIERGGQLSGMPRCLEGSRYYAQWAGMPYEVYSTKEGRDDYGDDINVRSYMTNLLGGGSCYMPDTTGRGVPIELSLAIHSDAGYTRDGKTNTGTLTICMTTFRDSTVNAGFTRLASRDLADDLLVSIPYDIRRKYGQWQTRELYDRNYSECRVPEVPSAILETLSHQNFADMRMAQDPNFRFDLARSIYKTLLRYTARMHHTDYVVQPLAPDNVCVTLTAKGEAKITWTATEDPYEPSAAPTCYVLYTAKDNEDFDNGIFLNSDKTSTTIQLDPDKLYSFRVAAVNAGGESFPSEVVSALYNPTAQKQVLVVNGFHRLASPKVRDNATEQGFDLNADIGVSYGLTAGWRGYQTSFDRSQMGKTTSNGLGFTNDSLAGQFIAGNDFDYIRTHASAIASARRYSIASCSSKAIENGKMTLEGYALVDLILGLECNDGYSLVKYQTFPKALRPHLSAHTSQGGALFVSGAYIGRDMTSEQDKAFLANLLKCDYGGTNSDYLERDTIQGLGTTFTFHRQPNSQHYAAQHPDILLPVAPAYPAMAYSDEQSACVAYHGNDYRALTIGFPFECIKEEQMRDLLMRGILAFLLQ